MKYKYSGLIEGKTHYTNTVLGLKRIERVRKALMLKKTTDMDDKFIATECGYSGVKHLRIAAKALGYDDFDSELTRLGKMTESNWNAYAMKHKKNKLTTLEIAAELETTTQTVLTNFRKIKYDVVSKKFTYKSKEKTEHRSSKPELWERVLYSSTLSYQ